jgi:hypothetical protein
MFDQPVDQRVRLTDAAETAEQHDGAVADSRHSLSHGLHDFIDHWMGFSQSIIPAPERGRPAAASRRVGVNY